MGLYDKIFKPKKLELSNGKVVEEKFTRTPLILLLVVLATWLSVQITGFDLVSTEHRVFVKYLGTFI